MKTIFLFIAISFILISCSNKDFPIDRQNDKIKSSRILNTITVKDNKIVFYSYLLGKVLVKYPNSKNILISQFENTNVVDLELFLSNNEVRNDFLMELNILMPHYASCLTSGNYNDPIYTKSGGDKLKQTGEPGDDADSYGETSGCALKTIKNELETLQFSDCFEIYSVGEINIQDTNSLIYVGPHPLDNIPKTYGYSFIYTANHEEQQQRILMDTNFLMSHLPINIFIVRPFRNDTCLYENIDVTDFTQFYSY